MTAEHIPDPIAELAREYGRGVTAGKLEALAYTAEERESYGKHIAAYEEHKELRKDLAIIKAQLAKTEALYETLADKHSILVHEYQDLIRRAFPTPIPVEEFQFFPKGRVIDDTILP